jgi:hypothetical protein
MFVAFRNIGRWEPVPFWEPSFGGVGEGLADYLLFQIVAVVVPVWHST